MDIRISISLPDKMYEAVVIKSREENTSISGVIEKALMESKDIKESIAINDLLANREVEGVSAASVRKDGVLNKLRKDKQLTTD